MRKEVYKSVQGRKIVESRYREILALPIWSPFEELFVSTHVARTHVLRFGEPAKPPLLMLHGSASNSAVWLGNVAAFLDHFCAYCVDIPGEPGLSEPVRCGLHTDEPQRWLLSLMDALGLGVCSFATMSLGSWYALNVAIHAPGRVRAISMLTAPGLVPAKKSFLLLAILCAMLGTIHSWRRSRYSKMLRSEEFGRACNSLAATTTR